MYYMMQELQAWLMMECERRNLSWAEASRRVGVAPNTISGIMSGQRPGLEVCKALAGYFDRPPETVLRLAGHLPPIPDRNEIDPELRHKADELLAIWRRLRNLDAESAERVMRIAVLQAEMVLAAVRSGQRDMEREGAPNTELLIADE